MNRRRFFSSGLLGMLGLGATHARVIDYGYEKNFHGDLSEALNNSGAGPREVESQGWRVRWSGWIMKQDSLFLAGKWQAWKHGWSQRGRLVNSVPGGLQWVLPGGLLSLVCRSDDHVLIHMSYEEDLGTIAYAAKLNELKRQALDELLEEIRRVESGEGELQAKWPPEELVSRTASGVLYYGIGSL